MRKIIFGLTVIVMAATTSAFTNASMFNKATDSASVGYLGPNEWVLAPSAEENNTWRCVQGGIQCLGNLKEGAIPNMDGSYNDADVEPIPSTRKFELIPQ